MDRQPVRVTRRRRRTTPVLRTGLRRPQKAVAVILAILLGLLVAILAVWFSNPANFEEITTNRTGYHQISIIKPEGGLVKGPDGRTYKVRLEPTENESQ